MDARARQEREQRFQQQQADERARQEREQARQREQARLDAEKELDAAMPGWFSWLTHDPVRLRRAIATAREHGSCSAEKIALAEAALKRKNQTAEDDADSSFADNGSAKRQRV